MRRSWFSKSTVPAEKIEDISLDKLEDPSAIVATNSIPEEAPVSLANDEQLSVDIPPVSEVPDDDLMDVGLVSVADLRDYDIDRYVAQLLPEEVVRRLNMLPLKIEDNVLHVAATEPLDLPGVDELKLLTGLKVRPVIVPDRELLRAINAQFSAGQKSKQAIIDMTFQEMEILSRQAIQVTMPELEEAPVVELVNSIIHRAINDGASDIHLEPQYPEMRARYRIDSVLHDTQNVPRHIEPAVVARIKLLADMDITERRRPQDGHIGLNFAGRHIDLRISTLLTANGEKMVIRILDKETMLIDIDHLGMAKQQKAMLMSFIHQPYGMILVTGPTGSGKSTTLHAALQQLDSDAYNIVTVENPVEYQIDGINQIQVNPQIDMTFGVALRTIVRQDPDIIMVGEIRDFETADIAINAALTGHLVLSTLHTNDAPGATVRLLDMGVQPFLTASAVIGVIAQRLLRTICPECRESYSPSQDERELLNLPEEVTTLERGVGCDFCRNTGYRGRTGIFEMFEVDEDVRKAILDKVSSAEMKNLILSKGMVSLSESARQKVLQGMSTTEEIRKVIYTGKD